MKSLQFLLPVFLFITSCSVLAPSDEQPKFEGTRWKLIAMNQKPVEPTDQVFIEFKEQKATGKAACNSFSAEYELRKSRVSFGNIISTKMFCDGLMDQENQIITNLQKVRRFEIRYGLLYLYGSDDLLLTYKK